MWEYKRLEKNNITPSQWMTEINDYAKEGWEIIYYNEQYIFVCVLKRKIDSFDILSKHIDSKNVIDPETLNNVLGL